MRQSVAEHDFPKLADTASEAVTIKDNLPLIYHWQEYRKNENIRQGFASYRDSLPAERRVLLDRFEIKDMAIKVVGVGSVGTLCAILLLMASEAVCNPATSGVPPVNNVASVRENCAV